MANNISLSWDAAWAALKTSTPANLRSFGRQLDEVPGGFVGWVESRPWKAQVEILSNAPEEVKAFMYQQNALSPEAVLKLNLRPSGVTMIDSRSRR